MTKIELEVKIKSLEGLLKTMEKENKELLSEAKEFSKIVKSLEKDNLVKDKFIANLLSERKQNDLIESSKTEQSSIFSLHNISLLINLIGNSFIFSKFIKIL